jgi:DNA-binding transcriptional LysR family regulator
MQFVRADLADFAAFLAIAKHRSFRRASLELGIGASALSHAMRGPESRTGVRLLNRTNRSVTLTAAGEELRAGLTRPFEAIGEAVEGLNRFRDAPSGRIRVNVPSDAASLLLGPVLPMLPSFTAHPLVPLPGLSQVATPLVSRSVALVCPRRTYPQCVAP